MTRELRKVHQFNTFSIVSPLQFAIARYLSRYPDAWMGLAAFFQAKRDLLAERLSGSGFEPVPAAGTYFQLVDYGAISRASDIEFADRLIREAKVATIPLSPFYAAPPPMTLLRLCIAKRDETLLAAAEQLRGFAARV
jgi:methionine aminotransferase